MKTIFNFARSRSVTLFLALLMLIYGTGCQTLFKVQILTPERINTVDEFGDKYFVLHAGSNVYELIKPHVKNKVLIGAVILPTDPIHYSVNRNREYSKEEASIVNEVHIFLSSKYSELILGQVEIPVQDVAQVQLIKKDGTPGAIAAGLLGVGLIAIVIGAAVSDLSKPKPPSDPISSCPIVYAHDGVQFNFQGEVYGGAIGANLCRDDYLPLPALQAQDGFYQVRMSNELQERQYIDLAQLIEVQHPLGTRVLLDKTGRAQLLQQEQMPINAQTHKGEDLNGILADKDARCFSFNSPDTAKNSVVLKFKKPAGVQQGNLILRARNSIWVDHILDQYFSKFGGKFELWMDKQSKRATEESQEIVRKNDLLLNVFLKKADKWQQIDELLAVGPLAYRDVLLSINLEGVEADEIELKLETGFMFWELDYAAMDFTPSEPLSIRMIEPLLALGTGDHIWTPTLQKSDNEFMVQATIGETTELLFPVEPIKPRMTRTLFLHTRGYYELIRDYTGAAKVKELKKLKALGSFAEFSRTEFLKKSKQDLSVPVF